MKTVILALFSIFFFLNGFSQSFKISGYISDNETSEPIYNAVVLDKVTGKAVYTNSQGFFSLNVQSHALLTIRYIGYNDITDEFDISSDTEKNYKLSVNVIDEVVITSGRNSVNKNETGSIELNLKEIKALPMVGFQTDVIKTLQVLPGINSGNEGMSALIVRGGSSDQNLVMVDGIPIYHYNHLDGLVSSFSTEAVKSLKLVKSGFHPKYGNRLSSVLDITLKDGNMNTYSGSANIGLITSGISLEGPIQKGKSSFIASLRGFTLQPFITLFPYASKDKFFNGYGFYDLFVKINKKIGNKDRIYVSFYNGSDKRKSNELFSSQIDIYNWNNMLGAVRWSRVWGSGMFSNLTFYASHYQNALKTLYHEEGDSTFKEAWAENKSPITDIAMKWDFEYRFRSNLQGDFGVFAGRQYYSPSSLNSVSILSYPDYTAPVFKSDMISGYVNADYKVLDFLSFGFGMRLNLFMSAKKAFLQPEPRAVLSLNLNDFHSVKASFAMMNQNMHALSISPLLIKNNYYIPASEALPPQKSLQYTLGYYAQKPDRFNFSIELFYKTFSNLTTFKDYVILSDITETWEDKTETGGIGYAEGIEAFVSQKIKSLNFGISYCLSRSTRQFENINNGVEYIYDFDRTHDLKLFMNGKIGKKWSYTVSWYYMSGQPMTLPVSNAPFGYYDMYSVYAFVSSKNNIRMNDYHRLDIAFQRSVVKKHKYKIERIWEFGIYNAYNNDNPSYYFWHYYSINNEPWIATLEKKSLFPIIPFITYQIKF